MKASVHVPEVLFITGSSASNYDEAMDANDHMVGATFKSFASQQFLPPTSDAPLRVYNDDSWDKEHGRKTWKDVMPHSNSLLHPKDIFEAQPWVRTAVDRGGPIDQFYTYAGDMEPTEQPLKEKTGKLMVRKVAAMIDAVSTVAEGTVVIWLDTDVNMNEVPKGKFLNFVKSHDISYVPFTADRQWNQHPHRPDFTDIESPYWRIESGIIALVANDATKLFLEEAKQWYMGGLLEKAKLCEASSKVGDCKQIWFQRNVFLNDIFAFSLLLHKNKHSLKQGWFWYGASPRCGAAQGEYKYLYSHTCQAQTEYTSTFNLEEYFLHFVGHTHEKQARVINSELKCTPDMRFNSTLSYRLFGYSPKAFHDEYWTTTRLHKRQLAGIHPADVDIIRPSRDVSSLLHIGRGSGAALKH